MESNKKNSGVSDAQDRRGGGGGSSFPALPVYSSYDRLPNVSAAGISGEEVTAVVEENRSRPESPVIAQWAVTKRGFTFDLEGFVEMFDNSRSAIAEDFLVAETIRRKYRGIGGDDRKMIKEALERVSSEVDDVRELAVETIRHLLKRRFHYVKTGREADTRTVRLEGERLRLVVVAMELEDMWRG